MPCVEPLPSSIVHSSGDVLAGRYRLLRPLAEGGMGSVWSARSLSLDIDVAVKVVKPSVASPRACERLLLEARAAASLGHPSIVRVLDCGTTDEGEPFLVMQLLRGKTLGAWLRERGKLPALAAVQLLLPIVGALAEVHGLDIVHRDIKPENIVLEEEAGGRIVPKLVDFGIAKHQSPETPCFTQSGVLMGSPAYMSPEQARGEHHVDSRSDIWSLCVVLYEMITGKRPFEGPNHGATLFGVFADAPVPTDVLGAGDAALWEILRRGLAKTKGARWQNMTQLGHALAAWAAARGATADSAGASISHRWLGDDGASSAAAGPQTTELPPRHRSSFPPDPGSQAHTLSSPASAPALPLWEPGAGVSSRSRGSMFGLGAALLVLTTILGFLASGLMTPGRTGAPAVAPPLGAASVPPTATNPVVPTATVTPGRPLVASPPPPSAPVASGTRVKPPGARAPRPTETARRPGGQLPMPLPRGPDF